MSCSEAREKLFDWDDACETHAAACPSCAALRKTFEAETRLLSSAPHAPENLWERIQSAVNERKRPVRMRWFTAAAAVFLAVIVGVLMLGGSRRSDPTINLVVVDASPEAETSLSGLVPSYEEERE